MPNFSPLITLFGISINARDSQETIQQIDTLISTYQKGTPSHYVATLNVDFIVNTYSAWGFSGRHLELLYMLRQASLVTLDGMPLIWLNRLLGGPIIERVTGSDLLPQLIEKLAIEKRSFFLLGGEERIIKNSLIHLQNHYPDLKFAGACYPKIYIEGPLLESSEERDNLLIEQINQAAPAILFINLGNPKQEIWFERVRHKLMVPVSIGIGGSFNLLASNLSSSGTLLAGHLRRAPLWMQSCGFEWLYRLFQEPKRLGRRYLLDLIKFPLLALPLIFYHFFNYFVYRLAHFYSSYSACSTFLFLSNKQTFCLFVFPSCLNQTTYEYFYDKMENLGIERSIVLDFRHVRHCTLEGLALIFQLKKRESQENKPLLILNMHWRIKALILFHRLADLIFPCICRNLDEVLIRIITKESNTNFFDSIEQQGHTVVIRFFGRLDNQQDHEHYLDKIYPIICHKNCILDFTYCTYIDSSGISFLLKLQKLQIQQSNFLELQGINYTVKKQLKLAKVFHLFDKIF